MADKQLISTIRSVAGSRPVFALSEILPYLDDDDATTVEDLFKRISGDLKELGFVAGKKGGDYEISRPLPPQVYSLNAEESARILRFFEQRTIPAELQESIGQYISRKAGKDWDDPAVIEKLRRAITAQKDDYWKPQHKRSLQYTKGYSVLGYLAYHFPVYFMQTEYLLLLLAQSGRLKKRMTILDIGTGPGVVPLAIADFYSRLDTAKADVFSIERSEEHIEAFLALRDRVVPRGGKVSIKPPLRTDLRTLDPEVLPAKIDLAVFSNVLNELPDATMDLREEIVTRIAERLAPDGTILIVEPADEENSTRMRSLTVALQGKGLNILSPCSFIWGTPCTAPRCWSFKTGPAIRLTRLMEAVARCEESFRFINTDIKYSYAVLGKEPRKKESYRLSSESKFLRLSKLQQHVGKRINTAGLKMSGELGNAKTHVYKICDGTAKRPVYAVLPSYHSTPENEVLMVAPYGTVLEMKGVLVRYNKGHDAYNLLVSRNTQVSMNPEVMAGDPWQRAIPGDIPSGES